MSQVCGQSKLNEGYAKHDYWSMVPKEELISRKFKCVFIHTPTIVVQPSPEAQQHPQEDAKEAQVKEAGAEEDHDDDDVFEAEETKEEEDNLEEMLREARRKVGELEAARTQLELHNKGLQAEVEMMRRRMRMKQLFSPRLEEEEQEGRQITGVSLHLALVILALAFLWFVIAKWF